MSMDSEDLNVTENVNYSKFYFYGTKRLENEIFNQKFIVKKETKNYLG